MNYLLPVLYILGLYGAYLAGFTFLRTKLSSNVLDSKAIKFRFPKTTLVLFLAIAIPSILQFLFPDLLLFLQRDATRFRQGEWWRLITPLFVQDGGISGTVFNLVSLAFVGTVAEQFWDTKEMLIIFFGGGLVGEIIGFLWQPVGAGNSVGNFSLAAAVALICLHRLASRFVQTAALVVLGADIVLVLLKDIHGPAAVTGAILAFVLSRTSERTYDSSN